VIAIDCGFSEGKDNIFSKTQPSLSDQNVLLILPSTHKVSLSAQGPSLDPYSQNAAFFNCQSFIFFAAYLCAGGKIEKNEMGGACGAYEGGVRCAQGSSGET